MLENDLDKDVEAGLQAIGSARNKTTSLLEASRRSRRGLAVGRAFPPQRAPPLSDRLSDRPLPSLYWGRLSASRQSTNGRSSYWLPPPRSTGARGSSEPRRAAPNAAARRCLPGSLGPLFVRRRAARPVGCLPSLTLCTRSSFFTRCYSSAPSVAPRPVGCAGCMSATPRSS